MKTSGSDIYQCASDSPVSEMVVCGATPLSDSVESSSTPGKEVSEMGNQTSLGEAIDVKANLGYSQPGSKGQVLYRPPGSNPSFGFVNMREGYQAKMRATTSNGRILGHDSRIIPYDVYKKIGSVSKGKRGDSYKVSFNRGGQDLTEYFND